VEANVAVASLVPRFCHEAKTHVADLCAADPAPDEHDHGATDPPPRTRRRPLRPWCTCRYARYPPQPRWSKHRVGSCSRNGAQDTYCCPQGQLQPRCKTKYSGQEALYRAAAPPCNGPPRQERLHHE
jgi:hypothetical protein